MQIILIRHGETTGDIENRYGGDYDDHLTQKGINQAKELSKKLSNKGVEKIFSSSRIRAQETSKILSEKLGCEVETVENIRERNAYGVLTGLTKEESRENRPDLVEKLIDPTDTIEGAEDYNDFIKRVKKGFEYVSNSQHQIVAIISHGGVIRGFFRSILNMGELSQVGDCSFIKLEKTGDTYSIIEANGINFEKLNTP